MWKIPVDGGREIQITRNGGVVALESIDSQWLYYTKGTGKTDLFVSSIDGSGEAEGGARCDRARVRRTICSKAWGTPNFALLAWAAARAL